MPKIKKDFRLSEEALANLEKFRVDSKLSNLTEALERLLLSNLLQKEDRDSSSGASDLIPCKQRLEENGEHYCVVPASIRRTPKVAELSTLEICRICQSIRSNLPANTRVPPTTETFDRPRPPVRDPNRPDMEKAGMKYCPEGLWVFPEKCERCRQKHYPKWQDCQRGRPHLSLP